MTKKGVREFYDKTARKFADEFYADEENLPVLRDFVAALPPGPRVLDLCCGAGRNMTGPSTPATWRS